MRRKRIIETVNYVKVTNKGHTLKILAGEYFLHIIAEVSLLASYIS